jgi:hypothetical protein
MIPSTNEDYVKWKSQPGTCHPAQEEWSRESMYNALIDSLNEAVQKIKKERQGHLFSGKPWKPQKKDSSITEAAAISSLEKDTDNKDSMDSVNDQPAKLGKGLKVINGGLYKPPEVQDR